MLSVYCDGSGQGFPGLPGGWGFVVLREGARLEAGAGGAKKTTSNQMELWAAIAGLRCALALRAGAEAIELVTDSRVAIDVALGREVPSRLEADSAQLRALFLSASAAARWVRGHSGDRWNEEVDQLAREARLELTPAKARRKQQAR